MCKYMPEVHLFLFVESEENQAIAKLRRALYLNIARVLSWLF
jgi:hypothetical protein